MKDRRGFLRLLGMTAATAAGVVLTGQEGHGDSPKRTFKGTSKTGDVEEALHKAIAAAEKSVRHPDAMVEWTLRSISGRNGGIAGFRDVTVTIVAKVS
jgi:hypothetical protein